MLPPNRWSFEAIGTRWDIDTEVVLGADDRARVLALIDDFDREWSRFRADSRVRSIAGGGSVPAPPDARAMLACYRRMSAMTEGAVNPLVGASISARGYDADYGFVDRGAEAAPSGWERIVHTRAGELVLNAPAIIDVGAIGKGRLADRVFAHLRGRVDGPIVVDAGGDLRADTAGIRVALEHPYDPAKAIGIWHLGSGALCASATNRRTWGDGLHHVLDARTGEPVRTIAATWAVAPDAMTADAVATALFFDGGPALAAQWGAAWVRMTTDGRVQRSPGAGAEVFT